MTESESMTDFDFLAFLAEPGFVIPWYAFGLAAAVGVAVDLYTRNTAVKPAVKWAWPIIVFFFSIVGLGVYLATSRPPGIGGLADDAKKERFTAYGKQPFRKTTDAVIHCVGGDGLGIMTAMVVARLAGFTFWEEFWFEYAVGFAFGWFIFQFKSMLPMAGSKPRALWMGGRAEFFSMMAVMAGMGAVMGYVTPLVAGEQPRPGTYAFWGFGALGLFVGYVVTYPMNWALIRIGWKHGTA